MTQHASKEIAVRKKDCCPALQYVCMSVAIMTYKAVPTLSNASVTNQFAIIIPFPIGGTLEVEQSVYVQPFLRYWALTLSVLESHDLDLTGSRGVISHVTIRCAISHFLLVVLYNQFSISNGFQYILPKLHVLIDTIMPRHCACAISRDRNPLCNI